MFQSLSQSSSFQTMHGGEEEGMPMTNVNSSLSVATSYHNSILLAHGVLFTILFLSVLPVSVLAAMGKRTKLHMSLQLANFLIFLIAIILAYAHEGQEDGHEVILENRSIKSHVYFGTFIVVCFFLQYALGVLKYVLRQFQILRALWRFNTSITAVHKWLGYSLWIMGLVQLIIGYTTYYNACAGHDINCIGHWLPGFAIGFFGFFILSIYIFHLQLSKPLEYYGSWVFITVGVPMMIFEHTWGEPWDGSDIFHVFLGGVLNILGGLLGLAAEHPYIKERILSYRIGNIKNSKTEEKTNENPRSENLNFIPALMVFINGLALLFHDQNPPFNATMHACMGVTLLILAPILLIMTMNEAVVLRLIAAFLLVLEGVFFFGVSYNLQLAAEQLFMGMFIEYTVILIGLTLMLFAYVGALMVAIQYCRARRTHEEYSQLQKEDITITVNPTVVNETDIHPLALKRATSGDEAHWLQDERSMNDGDMVVEVNSIKRVSDQLQV